MAKAKEQKQNNLELWESVQKTDPKQTKPAKIGMMNITSICPQYQRKNATIKFGPYGIGWGVKGEEWTIETYGDITLCRYNAMLWYKYGGEEGLFPINSNIKVAYITKNGAGYLKVDDEYAKKAQTDAITKGLSMIGFNSDVFEGLYDDNKYVAAMNAEFNPPPKPQPKPKPKFSELQTRLIKAIQNGNIDGKKWCKEQGILNFADIDDETALKYIEGVNNGDYNE